MKSEILHHVSFAVFELSTGDLQQRLHVMVVAYAVSSPPTHSFQLLTLVGRPTFFSESLLLLPCSTTMAMCEMAGRIPLAFPLAVQNGKAAFIMMCSFRLPEHQQPSRYWPVLKVALPEDHTDEVELIRHIEEQQPDKTEEAKA
jgi:hypothetical protein